MKEEQQGELETKKEEEKVPKRLVQIGFACSELTFSYLSDIEDIQAGDLVMVQGALQGEIGVVKKVKKHFKIPKMEMQWVERVVDREISGAYFRLGEDIVSFDCVLTAEKFMTLCIGKSYKQNNSVGEEEMQLDLEEFEKADAFQNELVKIRGKQLYLDNAVKFISLQNGEGKAFVCGGDWYEVDFRYNGEKITYLACDCPCFEDCKHEVALLHKLREILKKLCQYTNNENFVICQHICFSKMTVYGKGAVNLTL